ncbi:hypothetical protein GCM10018965_018840 [Nonomuraea roseola]
MRKEIADEARAVAKTTIHRIRANGMPSRRSQAINRARSSCAGS